MEAGVMVPARFQDLSDQILGTMTGMDQRIDRLDGVILEIMGEVRRAVVYLVSQVVSHIQGNP